MATEKKYPKIQSIYKRDPETHQFIIGKFSRDAFGYLQNNKWVFTEKIDGMNIRIDWDPTRDRIPKDSRLLIRGRSSAAQIPPFLLEKLHSMFQIATFEELYPNTAMILYGEGYGRKIQKGGANYIPDGVSFILFDVLIDGFWLERVNILEIALRLKIDIVPVVGIGTLHDALKIVRAGFLSKFGDFIAEGLVAKPVIELLQRNGKRVITKVKYKDFKWERQEEFRE